MVPLRKKGSIYVPEMKLFCYKKCGLIPEKDPVKMVALNGERMTFSTVKVLYWHGLKGPH